MSDPEIAKKIGVDRTAIRDWRRKSDLPANCPAGGGIISQDERAARLFLYSLGYSDHRISKERGRSQKAISLWRASIGLPAIFAPFPLAGMGGRQFRPKWTPADVLARIRRAIGRRLPPDIADDAVGDLYLAASTGEVRLEEIEAQARRYGNRVLDRFASQWGARSLDQDLGGDDEGLRLIDNLKDESSSEWLEEMGATAW